MTTFERFDPFEQRITTAIDEIAAPRRPEYLDGILRVTQRTSQRPRWSFPGRWFTVLDTAPAAVLGRPAVRMAFLVLAMALLALTAAAVFIAGSQPRLPLPAGPARNGAIVYAKDGALWVRSSISASDDRVLLAMGSGPGPGLIAPYVAPDGRNVAYVDSGPGGDYLYGTVLDLAASPQGAGGSLLLDQPIQAGWSQMWWSPDSSFLLVTGQFENGTRRLFKVPADGSGAQEIVLPGGLVPYDAVPSPTDPDLFLLRALTTSGRSQGLYLAHLDGSIGARFDLPGVSAFGPDYALAGAQWSPDGSTIAYNAFELDPVTQATSFRVHLVNADGTNDRPLPAPANPRIQQAWPTWSPDGAQLLVERFILGSDVGSDGSSWVAVVPADGSSAGRDLSPRSDGSASTGTTKVWSPDGSQVILWFSDLRRSYLVDIASGGASELPFGDDQPVWQPLAP